MYVKIELDKQGDVHLKRKRGQKRDSVTGLGLFGGFLLSLVYS